MYGKYVVNFHRKHVFSSAQVYQKFPRNKIAIENFESLKRQFDPAEAIWGAVEMSAVILYRFQSSKVAVKVASSCYP